MSAGIPPTAAFATLRGLARREKAGARCELCGLAIAQEHPHVFRRSAVQVMCACEACAILFSYRPGESNRDLIRIPREALPLRDFQIDDAHWNALRLPIDLAFFVHSSSQARVNAYYPSPAGSTESLLSLDAWKEIEHENPALGQMQPDIEALLVDRTRGNRRYFLAPIDKCYRLTGVIRLHWRGFSGGEEVWRQVDRFFESLEEPSRA